MIIYSPACDPSFASFGIEIPIKDSRSGRVVSELSERYPEIAEQIVLKVERGTFKRFDRRDLRYAHDRDYVRALMDGDPTEALMTAYELVDQRGNYNRYNPKNAQRDLVELRDLMIDHASLTLLAGYIALEEDFCFFLGGGMHHAMSFGGRGFCPINDVIITLKKMIADFHIRTAWIIDVDAHKGDGTAEILKDDFERLKCLSIHMKNGWPLNEGDSHSPWRIPSFVDIEIDEGEEALYNERLRAGLEELDRRSKHRPGLAVILAGQDPYEKDELPSSAPLRLTKEQMLERDLFIYHHFKELGIPQLWLLAGGYGDHAYEIPLQFLSHLIESGAIPKSHEA